MSDRINTSGYDLPLLTAWISSGVAADAALTRPQLIEQARGLIATASSAQKEWSSQFDQLYEKALASDWTAPFLMQWVVALLQKQQVALERLSPLIEILQRRATDYAAKNDIELLDLCQATIALVLGWVRPYQILDERLLELASSRRFTAADALRARPAMEEIDHRALTREIIARFPKILAALAE